jgi:ABC-type multidrug transport system fused ATPase/permease subunit
MFYKCPTGSVKPTVCPLLSVCPPGSSADQPIIIGATIDVGIIVFIIVAYYVYVCIRDAMRKKGDERRKKHITQEPQPVVISDTIVEDEILAFDVLEQPKPTSFTMSISFSHLKLIASKKVIIENLSGRIRGGKLTAVMGLSGSGKTSLLNVLAGRAFYGTVTGEIKINGRRDNLRWHRGLVGYVPQDDIMLRTMTVEETLYFAARCRLDSGKYAREVNAIVERAIRILGLEDIRYSIIGDEKQRGISGGQRKRVNVCLYATH